MNANRADEPGYREGRIDLLSADEEIVLAEMRTLVASVRAAGQRVDPGWIRRALATAGASIVDGAGETGSVQVELRGVQFSLRPIAVDAFEISFPAIEP
jgi:hypothetical protein